MLGVMASGRRINLRDLFEPRDELHDKHREFYVEQ